MLGGLGDACSEALWEAEGVAETCQCGLSKRICR